MSDPTPTIGVPATLTPGDVTQAAFARPYVVSWNLTYRCNLACEHCYLDAGPSKVSLPAFSDRRELSTEQCRHVVDEIAAFAPECVTILTGGEPLLRRDILDIVRHAVGRGLWVVIGTNGVKITENLARLLAAEGVRGLALSLDALDPDRHDAFRRVRGAFANTVEGAKILHQAGLPFIVQTTVGSHNHQQLEAIAEFAHRTLGAKVWNLYFLVPTGRGAFVSDLEPDDYDRVLGELAAIQRRYAQSMLVNAKCAPHFVRTVLADPDAATFPKAFAGGAGGCPAGTHYLGIRPNGDVTPCPYLPLFAGNLEQSGLRELWEHSPLFGAVRDRARLGGRCGACELGSLCGGCRARAYGMTGDVLAEDPLCSHQPGSLTAAAATLRARLVEYGRPAPSSGSASSAPLDWHPAARERMQRIPAFVRGMVTQAVERWCAERGIAHVSPEILEEIRARMPTPKVFGR